MSKIYFQGTFGAYSHLAALEIDPNANIIFGSALDETINGSIRVSLVATGISRQENEKIEPNNQNIQKVFYIFLLF